MKWKKLFYIKKIGRNYNTLKVFIDYLDSYSCEIYYHKGIYQLKNEDGTWSNLIIPIFSLSCTDNFKYNDEGYCDDNSIKNLINESNTK